MALRYSGTPVYESEYDTSALYQIGYGGNPVWYALQKVTITGTAQAGSTLTASVVPSDVASLVTYKWYRATNTTAQGTLISGATASTYTLTTSDRGKYVHCEASIGSITVASNRTAKVLQPLTAVSVSGTKSVGSTLTASATPSTATVSYQWYRGNTAITGATSKTYVLTSSDRAKTIKCKCVASGEYTGTITSAPTSAIYGWVARTGTLLHKKVTKQAGGWSDVIATATAITTRVRKLKIVANYNIQNGDTFAQQYDMSMSVYGGSWSEVGSWRETVGASSTQLFEHTYTTTGTTEYTNIRGTMHTKHGAGIDYVDIKVTNWEEWSNQ